jgi:phosphatidylserine decarboxylase
MKDSVPGLAVSRVGVQLEVWCSDAAPLTSGAETGNLSQGHQQRRGRGRTAKNHARSIAKLLYFRFPSAGYGKIDEQVIVSTGIYYALGFYAAAGLVVWLAGPWFALPLFLLGSFFLWFFRDPEREIAPGAVAVSPADGRVMAVKPEGRDTTRISIFLNVFDVHVNRTPVGGVIRSVKYQPGLFLVASKERCSAENEQNIIVVETEDGLKITFKQIAGLIARRVVFTRKVGDTVAKGERIGLMKFGSRMDVIFGPEWELLVKPGMRVTAGSIPIARRRDRQPAPSGAREAEE